MKTLILLFAGLCLVPVPATAQSALRVSLDDAISRGLENSHRIAEARAREEGAQAAARTASLADKPLAGATAGYTRTNHVTEFAFPQPNGNRLVVYPDIPDNLLTRLSFQWPIYTSGRTDALERAAQAEAGAAGADLDTARADLRLEITRAYWAAVTSREAVRVLEESAQRADAQLKDARERFDVGLIPPNEVSSLEAQRSRERAQLIEAQNVRESALIDLRRLMGVTQDTIVEPADNLEAATAMALSGEVAALVKQALDSRTERKALTLRLGGVEARRQAALAGNKPTVAFVGGVDYANPNPKIFPRKDKWQHSWEAGVNVNWSFADFGRARAQAAEAGAALTATRERIAEFDAVVDADVRQRLLDVESTRAQVGAATDAMRSAADARRVVADRFAAGVATSTDVLVAQVALLEAQLARTRALAAVRLAEARLQRSLGQ